MKKMLKLNYGFSNKHNRLYPLVKSQKGNFKILFENDAGVVFKILSRSDNLKKK
jgi:hypothetical protein